ncbi:NLR family CARD domain-containing protein 4-like [Branchiostoma floridae x Branchiostoma japonicum]
MGSPDHIGEVLTSLADLYSAEYAHVRPLPWCEDLNLPLAQVFTNLQLQVRDDRGRFKNTNTIVSLADIYKTKWAAVKRIRVEGPPGIGKSCSCQKLALVWSSGNLGNLGIVFLLEMRHLSGKVKDAIFEQLLPKDIKITPDQLWSIIEDYQHDVLFILDGLDELSQAAREVTDVVDLIQGKILRNCHVLVTSRPYQCVKDLENCHRFYKIVGYSQENSIDFIYNFFGQTSETAAKLVVELTSNTYLSEIVVNPLNNVLICVVWRDNGEKLPSSKAELYEMIVYSIIRRYCSKKDLPFEEDASLLNVEEALRGLGELSWEGLQQDRLQFNIDDITAEYGVHAEDMLNLDLLTRDYSFSLIKRTCYCSFLHKTFQEYFAAYFIGQLVVDESKQREEMEDNKKSNPIS